MLDELIAKLNSKNIYISELGQISKGWYCSLRKKGDWSGPRGYGRTAQAAIKNSLKLYKQQPTEKDWSKLRAAQRRKKRPRLKGSR